MIFFVNFFPNFSSCYRSLLFILNINFLKFKNLQKLDFLFFKTPQASLIGNMLKKNSKKIKKIFEIEYTRY